MSVASVLETTTVIDADVHVTEPPDLWTKRLPSKWRDDAPHVEVDPQTGESFWRVSDQWITSVGHYSAAGWKDYPPSTPPSLEEADPAAWVPTARLERMEEYGIRSQVLYPNILGFDSARFLAHHDQDFALACVQAYNDFQIEEYYSLAPEQFIPIAVMPFWDLDASVTEMKRCAENNHKGVLLGNKYEQVGLPSFTDRHWNSVYAAAQEMNLSINFHVGFQAANPNMGIVETENLLRRESHRPLRETQKQLRINKTDRAAREALVRMTIPLFMGNAETLTALLTSDLCERFPRLNFVSVESGFGYIPYLLEALDWQWKNLGAHDAFPDRLLPSEYFIRQCYGTFWFEKTTLPLLLQFADNFMWSTDFPHPTSLSPGPASPAENPLQHLHHAFAETPDDVVRKVLHDNAARVYHLS